MQTNIETFLKNSDSLISQSGGNPKEDNSLNKKAKKNVGHVASTNDQNDENHHHNMIDSKVNIKPLYTIHAHAHRLVFSNIILHRLNVLFV